MSGKLNKQEQVQVVIRLKPQSQEHLQQKSVYVSDDQDKTLVVETPYKKQLFVFDNIANEDCTQEHLYEQIGKQILNSSTEGFNCCIFAYGQTGAGKTYSILGKTHELATDIYCQSRGILPRLLNDLYNWHEKETDRWVIRCSYMEIYNEQIFDLLNVEEKNRQIREDLKRGVFVEGLSEEKVLSYEHAMKVLLKGVKNRKISTTSMNNQSSRSHTIFTLNIESEIKDGESVKIRRSKINIVDLAGSQRAKQTKVEGERLKQGCNINKSLHVLGNVINALVQSSKKKKHIPFRDSKLTHFLKDSLCGNSITKLLANIHPSKSFLGETLSTLMFAKRAKILKLKVQTNENVTQNFQQLRKQIKRLREELAEARYIKNQSKVTERNMSQYENDTQIWEKMNDISGFDIAKNETMLKVFEQNEINYKSLMQIYEEHMKVCSQSSIVRKNINMHKEWKNLEKKNEAYRNLLKNMPAFTKIFHENILLRNQISKQEKKEEINRSYFKLEKDYSYIKAKSQKINKEEINEVIEHYESLILDIQEKFAKFTKKLQQSYEELQIDNKAKEEKIKDLMKRKQLPPDLEQLQNQNQYLKLNIMQLEDEITEYEKKVTKFQISLKQAKKKQSNLQLSQSQSSQTFLESEECQNYLTKLNKIKNQLQQEIQQYQQSQKSTQNYLKRLQQQFKKKIEQNKMIAQDVDILSQQNKELKKKLNQLLKIENEGQISKQNNISTFWGNEQSNISEQFMQMDFLFDRKNLEERNKMAIKLQKEEHLREKTQKQLFEQMQKRKKLADQISKLHSSYSSQILDLKQEIKQLEKENKRYEQKNKSLQEQILKMERNSEMKEPWAYQKKKIEEQDSTFLKVEKSALYHVCSDKNLLKNKKSVSGEEKLTEKERKDRIAQLRRKVSTGNLHKKLALRLKDDSTQFQFDSQKKN